MLGGNQAYAQPPSPLPTPAPVQSGVRPGNLGGGPVPMGGSAPQPEPTPSQPDISQLLSMLDQYLGNSGGTPPNWLEQQRNPNGTPYQSQAGRPETLSDFYGPHGISPTATFATAASPINYMGLFGASDPYWGSNAMPGRFPTTQSPMMQMESALKGTPYEQYAFEPYMDRIRTPTQYDDQDSGLSEADAMIRQILQTLNAPWYYNNTQDEGSQIYDQDLYAGGQ